MKRRFEAEGSTSHVLQEKIPSIQTESLPAEMAADSANDLVERLMKLPIELKQMIIFSFSPKERRLLRLVNKAMLDIVDKSMSDVQMMKIDLGQVREPNAGMLLTTINPFYGAKDVHSYSIVRSSLPFLLKWSGAQLKRLKLIISANVFEHDNSHLTALYRLFEVLSSENTSPKLKNLSLSIGQSLWDNNEILHSELLKCITNRQLQAKAVDPPTPFLHSLSLTSKRHPIRPKKSALKPLVSEKRRKLLQDLLDQCHGLKELDVDSLLVQNDLPIVALRYPTTLIYLKTMRLGTTPGDLTAIINNCPNFQIVDLNVEYSRDDADVHALASLSDLRELTLMDHSTEEEIAQIISQGLAALEDHPFGASIARPWPQLKSVTLNFYDNEYYENLTYRFILSGANCCITSLHLTEFESWWDIHFAQSVEQLFEALNSCDACPNLMELNISSCELVYRIKDSLVMKKYCDSQALEQWLNLFGDDHLHALKAHVHGMLNDILTYVTKRQSEVQFGKPFLCSLSIRIGVGDCCDGEGVYDDMDDLRDQLEHIHITVQQIFDQCHGLEVLYMDSLEDGGINPKKKRGKELMELVPLRFPRTLKKLNGVRLN